MPVPLRPRRPIAATAALIGILATTLTTVPTAAAVPGPEPTTPASVATATDKLTDEVAATLAEDGQSDFWVRFEEQADLEPAKKIVDWTERGQFVYDALADVAQDSQGAVAAELETAGVEYESYPIANAILVEDGTRALALDLAASGDVSQVHEPFELEPVEPVRQEPVSAAAQGVEWGLENVRAPEAWAMGTRGGGITVSSIDTGVQHDHPALLATYRGAGADGKLDHDYNWFDGYGTCSDGPCDMDGHGTHTMGTMVGDDGAGNQIGVAPDAEWITTNGCCTSDAGLLGSGWWLLAPTDTRGENPDVSKRPHVINNSWGEENEHAFHGFFTAIDAAWTAAGIFSVWAAGNTTGGAGCDTVSSPGSHPAAYSVGAYDVDGVLGEFSRKGEGEDAAVKPEISAPGVDVRSSWPGNRYHAIDGTSMAAPHVAGAVALLWSYDPTLVGQIEETRRLLAESAVDVDDTECGGTAQLNNKYGEGRLDVVRLLALAPRVSGELAGTVTSDGEPVADALVVVEGPSGRSLRTANDGTFSTRLAAGEHEVTVTAFGYEPTTTDVTISAGQESTVDVALAVAARHDLSGTVVTTEGDPVANAEVTLRGTPLATVRTDADGAFRVRGVPEGDYTLFTRPNGCLAPSTSGLTVDGEELVTIPVEGVVDEWGYRCTVSEGEYRRGTEKVAFSGVMKQVSLPFPVALYNGSHQTLNVGRRGFVSVDSQYAAPGNGGPGIFPFYVLSPLRTDNGGVYTGATTVDGEDAFVVEYRDVVVWGGAEHPRESGPVSFSVTITRSGTITVAYGAGVGGEDPLTAGLVATTGIQGWAGQDGIQYSDNSPVLYDGLAVTYDMPDFGYIDFSVVDANDGLPVAGAQVAIRDADGPVESLTSDATGAFRRQLHTGSYTVEITAPHYAPQTHEVELGELYDTAAVAARLTTGIADAAADGLDTVLGTDPHGTGSLTVTNTGSEPVSFDLAEVGRHAELDAPAVVTRTLTGTKSAIDLSGWTAEAPKGASSSDADSAADGEKEALRSASDTMDTRRGGDVLARIELEGTIEEKEPAGLGYDGDVWIHDHGKKTNAEFTVTGKKTGTEFAADWNPEYGAFDMALDTLTGDMCQMEDSPTAIIHCFDRETGEKSREIKGEWSEVPLTGLAYDPGRDVFYVGGWHNGRIGTIAGTSHDDAGQMLSYCTPPLREVIGLAYNSGSDTIWYSDRALDRQSRLLQIDPADCSFINAWWFPEPRDWQGGGLEADISGALWAVDQMKDEVVLVEVEDDQVTDLPWLSLSQTDGVLAPGESTTIDVGVSTEGTKPGAVLGANIVVRSDAGRISKQYVPVTVTTSAYQIGVNAGGQAVTDSTGFRWSADRMLEGARWGYRGRTKAVSTQRAIEGTDDDPLFQSQRVPLDRDLKYAFDEAPAGTYVLELGYAEIEQVKGGKRVFDVLVNGSLTQYAYDPASMVGPRTADVHTALVQHDGGLLTVELRGTNGLRPPSIASLRVTLDPRDPEVGAPQPSPGPAEEVRVSPAEREYALTLTPGLYRQGTTKTPWTGSGSGILHFDFDFPFYDTTWDGVCVGLTGMLTFDRRRSNSYNTGLPSNGGADAIYPFWDDLYVDDEAGVYIGTTEVGGLAAQIIEYRDVTFHDDPSLRVSFSVTLVADGRIQIGYGPGVGGEDPRTRGGSATVGVESRAGNAPLLYSYDQPALSAGTGIELTLPATGTLEGTVADANDAEPVAGATVTLMAPDGGTRTITADEQGRWKAQMLLGEHTVEVSTPGYVATTDTVDIAEAGQAEELLTALTTGVVETSGDDLDWLLGPDESATAEVTITNTGSAPMEVVLTEQSQGEAVDLPWLTLSGDAVDGGMELAEGESTTVEATVNTAGLGAGSFTGDVLVSSTTGRNPERLIPVEVGSSAYWLGVDVGGRGGTGADGFFWSADQQLGHGADWGYVGGRARGTRADVDGTQDDLMFRTQRTGTSFSYVFKDVPAGSYQVELGFAEIDNGRSGRRQFDVLVGGEVALYEHDVHEAVGRLAADTRTVTVAHDGGDLVVDLVGETGEGNPILNTLRVLEDPRS